jgi:pyruvate,water dikinase
MTLAIPFDVRETPALAEVGGKALSLIQMTEWGLPVPAGFVLTREFFGPWLDAVAQSAEWRAALAAPSDALPARLAAVRARLAAIELDEPRRQALAEALARLPAGSDAPWYAVRSSSPEEDLEGASFAGGYESVLGVTPEALPEAIRHCAVSCLSARVLLYKRQQGFDAARPSIAVIVQRQVAAETAGVAFSLNPVNNCYDEAVINANLGLGEAMVSGRVSPDQFVVDKTSLRILERELGSKEVVLGLGPRGARRSSPAPGATASALPMPRSSR